MVQRRIGRRQAILNLCHHDRASLLAGKLHAVLTRPWTKGRDLFDLVWYLADRTWPSPNLGFLNAALHQTGWGGPLLTARNWRKHVREKVADLDWNKARDDVKPFLERQHDLDLVSLGPLTSVLSS
jgi:hypothetical protein